MSHRCINCNADEVARTEDTFICKKCGYRWDVAHEQANAAYLASQGRAPAEATAAPSEKPGRKAPSKIEPDAKPDVATKTESSEKPDTKAKSAE